MKVREREVELTVKVGKSSGCVVARWCEKHVVESHSRPLLSGCLMSTSRPLEAIQDH